MYDDDDDEEEGEAREEFGKGGRRRGRRVRGLLEPGGRHGVSPGFNTGLGNGSGGRRPHVTTMEEDERREEAITRAFRRLDLNGDGVITYLELRKVFNQQHRRTSEFELREWIKMRGRRRSVCASVHAQQAGRQAGRQAGADSKGHRRS